MLNSDEAGVFLLKETLNYVLETLEKGNMVELHIKGFASPLYEKQYNTRHIRRWVDKSFVPSTQKTSKLNCRLTDLKKG